MDERDWTRFILRLGILALLLVSIGRLRRGAFRELGRDLLSLRSTPTWVITFGTVFLLLLTFGAALAAVDGGMIAWILLAILAIADSIFLNAMVGRLRERGS